MSVGRTLAILKPDLVAYPQLAAIVLDRLLRSSLQIRRAARLRIPRVQAEQLYAEHVGRFYYPRLIRHICSGPAVILELADRDHANDAVAEWRKMIGPSKFLRGFGTADARTETIRWTTAWSDVRNAVHGADSAESVRRELAVFEDQLCVVDESDLRNWFESTAEPDEETN